MRDSFIQTLENLACKDRNILLLTGDLGFGVFNNFRQKYQKQFINAGVAEQNMTAMATGLALEGKIVFTYSIGNFPTLRCLEQIRNDACYHDANVKVVCVGGGFSYGALGISHHATEDIAIMRSLPNITVLSPCTAWEVTQATKLIAKTPGTFYLRLDKSKGEEIRAKGVLEIGKARILKEGKDCSIIVTGGILEEVWEAEKILRDKYIDARIISMHTIKPIDKEIILASVEETKNIVTVEEHTMSGGLGSAVAEVFSDKNKFPQSFLRIGLKDRFSSIVGSQKYLRKCYKLDALNIAERIEKLFTSL